VVLGLVALMVWAARRPPPPPPPSPAAESQATMESLALTEIQAGEKRWILAAEKAEFLKDRSEIRIRGVEVDFIDPKEDRIRVRCQEGLINTKTRGLTLKGQVELGYRDLLIRTSQVTYQPAERLLLAPEEVTLEGPRLRVQGKGLRVELADKRLVLAQHHLTEVKLAGREPRL
jgi:LPS export ABC transporter protein LptC